MIADLSSQDTVAERSDVIISKSLWIQWSIRAMFLLLFLTPFFFFRQFVEHIGAHFSGGILDNTIRGQWHVVVLNIMVFVSFLIPLKFRRTVDWKEYGLVSAFFISLFIEMYGLPLSIMFMSNTFGDNGVKLPESAISFRLLGIDFIMTHAMVYGLVVMTIGSILIGVGWVTLYRNIQDSEIVTKGIYSYSRHPQYLGFILVILGWFIGWPTLLTIVFSLTLVWKYLQVCTTEERELGGRGAYQSYKKRVPFFI